MQSRRHERVRELIKRELSSILLREFPVSEVGLLTVNEVALAGDLQSAVVYVGVVGSPEQRRQGLAALNQQRARIQSMVASAVVLKYTPQLRFVADEAIARGNRVLEIIEEIERTSPPESAPTN
ncbi:MAG TPA: 30S ribosome-binding factor RbfA [Verrucomicrobiota bacterium]|nr:30S ribosome-binding factor RbfA [Verrucomicrobiota bacterium]HRZ36971.1 30S ribosome-binding factor RbfA [Candidatus Paceibacterota bacterium]HRZ56270.1 30S ribosome-binding factor RbfA [Candidatus Paceibacterota bacterium]